MTELERKELSVLVPLDGSHAAEAVLPILQDLGSHLTLKLFLLHAIEKYAPEKIHGEPHLKEAKAAQAYLEAIAQRLASTGAEVNLHVHQNEVGDVAGSILEHATEMSPALILLCTHGRGDFKDALFGSIAQKVLTGGHWPVLLIPPEISKRHERYDLRRVLMPLDGTHDYQRAMQIVEILVRAGQAELHFLFVIPEPKDLSGEESLPGRFLFTSSRALTEMAEEGARQYLSDVRERYQSLPLSVSTRRGEAVSEIVKYAEQYPIDLLVITSHGKKGLEAFLSRSAGARLINRISCPLLLVKN
jgi:nucleotide-binding universal stress UspA family protein